MSFTVYLNFLCFIKILLFPSHYKLSMENFVSSKLTEVIKPIPYLPPPYCRKVEKRETGKDEKLHSLKLVASNPSKLLLLYETLHDNCSKSLEVKINNHLMDETTSKLTFLMHLSPLCDEAVIHTIGRDELETSMRFPLSQKAIKQIVLCEKEALKCDDNLNPQIISIFRKLFDNLNFNAVIVPILGKNKFYPCSVENMHPVLLACFINSERQEDFIIKVANELFKYCLPVLSNIMAAEEERRQKQQYQSVLSLIQRMFFSLEDVNEVIKLITNECRKLTNAQKCLLHLSNPDHVELISKSFNDSASVATKTAVNTTKDHIIPDYVVNNGKLLNVQDISHHFLTDKSLSDIMGCKTKNVLCFPIKNENGVIGAVQLCNKRYGNFTHFDEEIVNTLSTYCGLSLTHSLKYTELENFKIRNKICSDVMINYIQVKDDEVNKKISCPLSHIYPSFEDFTFCPRTVAEMESVCFVLRMFEELGFFAKFGIKRCLFTKFVLYVKQGCRDVPYHNWMHLFCTAHFNYLCLKKLQLVEKGYITHLEALACFVACLTHDVDYRGANSSFQEKCNSSLAGLYSSPGSVLERHRFSQVLRILSTEGCNFLETFGRESYTLFMNLLKDMMLATDLATHVRLYKKEYNIAKGGYDRNNPEHRYVFSSLLITCADLSDHSKDWSVSKQVVGQLYVEFFTRGDLERRISLTQGEITRDETILFLKLQIDFLRQVCLPLFKLLATLFDTLRDIIHRVKQNILYWESSKHIFQKALEEAVPFDQVLSREDFDENVKTTIHLLEMKK